MPNEPSIPFACNPSSLGSPGFLESPWTVSTVPEAKHGRSHIATLCVAGRCPPSSLLPYNFPFCHIDPSHYLAGSEGKRVWRTVREVQERRGSLARVRNWTQERDTHDDVRDHRFLSNAQPDVRRHQHSTQARQGRHGEIHAVVRQQVDPRHGATAALFDLDSRSSRPFHDAAGLLVGDRSLHQSSEDRVNDASGQAGERQHDGCGGVHEKSVYGDAAVGTLGYSLPWSGDQEGRRPRQYAELGGEGVGRDGGVLRDDAYRKEFLQGRRMRTGGYAGMGGNERRAVRQPGVQQNQDASRAGIGEDLGAGPGTLATSPAGRGLREMGLCSVTDPCDECAQEEEENEEPEEGRPGRNHVDHGHEDSGENASGCEFVAYLCIRDQGSRGNDLGNVSPSKLNDAHDSGPWICVRLSRVMALLCRPQM
nr:hypothetical protein CFP56_11875 [Quercus suber]